MHILFRYLENAQVVNGFFLQTLLTLVTTLYAIKRKRKEKIKSLFDAFT